MSVYLEDRRARNCATPAIICVQAGVVSARSMMKIMKRGFVLIWATLMLSPFLAGQADLSAVRRVYMLPMSNGFEQYLANHLTMNNVLQVVTDPEQADAVFTDHIGLKLERQLDELYPPPPEEEEESAKDETEGEEEEAESAAEPGQMVDENVPPISTFSRGRGNVFLVDRRSRDVVWSMYHQPKRRSPEKLDEAAARVIYSLRESMGLGK